MKYIAVIILAVAIYLFLKPQSQIAPSATDTVATQAPSPRTDFLKRPIDRTNEVLQQARNRADDPALK